MLKQLDLFCSGVLRGWENYEVAGVDYIAHPESDRIKQADLVIEPIPFADNEFDLVTVYDGLEHMPALIYAPERREPIIELFNEIYRVLKPDGIFYSQTPSWPNKGAFQDPSHVSFWTDETFNYFSGDYYSFHDHYNYKFDFKKEDLKEIDLHLQVTLKAIKPMRKEFTL